MAPMRRNTIRINFVQVPAQLKELVAKVSDTTSFIRRHGNLLGLVTSKLDEQMMSVLRQFFDPLYHYFTFLDYQLVPTLEEFSLLLGVPVLDQIPFTVLEEIQKYEVIVEALHLKRADTIANWETRSGVKGFLAMFILEKARSFWDDIDFQAFEDILDLRTYDLVLFPTSD